MAKVLRPLLDSLSIFTNFATSVHEVGIVRDVVSVEDAAGLMSRNDHRNLLRDAVGDHVPYPGSPEIVEQQPFVFPFAAARLTLHYRNDLAALLAHKLASSSNNTRLPPSIPEISNRLAIITSEDEILGNLSYGAG